jgi:hypothetical protein
VNAPSTAPSPRISPHETTEGDTKVTSSTDEAIRAFRVECAAVSNSPLASLCTDALGGDPAARQRVASIMAGEGDLPLCREIGCRELPEPGQLRCKADSGRGPMFDRPHRPALDDAEPGSCKCEICGRYPDDGIHMEGTR